jgi:tagatose 1,6-diphosphate aldolase
VEKVKRLGASAVKLLLYYRPDLKDIASKQLDLVKKLADECRRADIPLLIEPKSYPIGRREKDPWEFARVKPQLVIETASHITAQYIDVLKAEFPGDPNYEEDETRLFNFCQQLDKASQVPWVILSAGVNFELFYKEVKIACRAGASGFLAGRALWQEATHIRSRTERLKFLETTVAKRFRQLSKVANTYGRPWYTKLEVKKHKLASIDEGWYQTY